MSINIAGFIFLALIPTFMLHVGRLIEIKEYGSFRFTLMSQSEKDRFSGAYGLFSLAFSICAGLITSASLYESMYESNLSFVMTAGVIITCIGVWTITSLVLGLLFFIMGCTPILSESEDSNEKASRKILINSCTLVSLTLAGVGYYIFSEMGTTRLLLYTSGSILIGAPLYILRYHTAKLKSALSKAKDDIGYLTDFLANDKNSKPSVIYYCLWKGSEDILNLCWHAGIDFDDNACGKVVKIHIERKGISISDWILECPDALKSVTLKMAAH